MGKKLIRFLFITTTLVTLTIIGLVIHMTWNQYQDTKEWQKTELTDELKDTPPFLARNYVQAKDQKAAKAWQKVTESLNQINKEDGIKKEQQKEYQKIHDEAATIQKEYESIPEDIGLEIERLQLYLDLENVLETAYKKPETEKIKELADRLYTLNLVSKEPVDEVYFTKLHIVAEDYKNLAAFLSEEFPKLGMVENNTLLVNTTVNEDTTSEIQTKIDERNLEKFPLIKKLKETLSGNDWAIVLRENEWTRDYETWQVAKNKLESVQKSAYWQAGSITTYQQALDAGLSVIVTEQDGFTIKPESSVDQILYNGIAVDPMQYIRYGTPVDVVIKEEYEKIKEEKKKKPQEEDTEDDDESDEDGDQTNEKPKNDKPEKTDPDITEEPDEEDPSTSEADTWEDDEDW